MLYVNGLMTVGKGCPPTGGKECTVIRGTQNPNNHNLEVRAILRDDEDHQIAQAMYTITEDFLDEVETTMPEAMYSWYPKYSGGEIPTSEKIEELRKNFHPLLQDWLCNHAHAHLVLEAIPSELLISKKKQLEVDLFTKDIEETFSLETRLPPEEDFLSRLQKIVSLGHEEFMKQILSTHVALYYKIHHKQAVSFLQMLATKGYITLNERAGYHIPYGSRNTHNAFGIASLTQQGMTYKGKQIQRLAAPKCFVIMPLAGLNHQYGVVVAAWKEVFGEDAPVYHQDDDLNKAAGELLDEKIQANIRDATMVVAILSMGEKERPLFGEIAATKPELLKKAFPLNANVLVELGYALRCGQDETCNCKDVLILTEKPQPFDFLKDVFDIRNRNLIPYDTGDNGEVELREELAKVLHYLKERYRL